MPSLLPMAAGCVLLVRLQSFGGPRHQGASMIQNLTFDNYSLAVSYLNPLEAFVLLRMCVLSSRRKHCWRSAVLERANLECFCS
jgi:hypothetical protein